MKFVRCTLTILVIFFISVFLTSKVNSQSVTFSVGVEDSSIEFLGYTSPNGFITFKEGGSVIGTTTADSVGYYYKNFTAVLVGIHTIEIYSTDVNGVNTPQFSYEIVVLPTQITSISFDFPPTLQLNKNTYTNEDVLVKGLAKPNSNISIKLDGSGIQEFNTISNNSGEISFIILKQFLPTGDFIVNAYLTDSIDQSYSNTLNFQYNPGFVPIINNIPEGPIKDISEQISGLLQEYFWAPLGSLLNNGGRVQGEVIETTTLDNYLQNTFVLVAGYLVIITSVGLYILYRIYGTKRN